MYIACLIIFFILGLHIGSFLAVIAIRTPKHESFLTGHSRCDNCNHELKFLEMIPVFSYVIQRGRCRHCGEKISSLLPIVELLTGCLFALSFYLFGFNYNLFIALGIVALFIIVLVADIIYMIIPDQVIVFFSIYFIGLQFLNVGFLDTLYHILTGILLFTLMYLIMLAGNKLFKKESMGGADIKLMFIFGLLLDPLMGCVSIFLGSFIALPVSLYLLHSKHEHIIPFGPFLTLSLLIIYFTGINTTDIIRFLGC